MQEAQTVVVDKKKVSCDGGAGALGHPKVYLIIGKKGNIDCPYCGKKFKLKEDKKAS